MPSAMSGRKLRKPHQWDIALLRPTTIEMATVFLRKRDVLRRSITIETATQSRPLVDDDTPPFRRLEWDEDFDGTLDHAIQYLEAAAAYREQSHSVSNQHSTALFIPLNSL